MSSNTNYWYANFWALIFGLGAVLYPYSGYSDAQDCDTNGISSQIETFNNIDFEEALNKIDLDKEELFARYDTSCVVKLYVDFIKNTNGKSAIYHLVFDDLWDALLLADQANLVEEKFKIYLDLARFFGYIEKYEKAEEYFGYASEVSTQFDIDPDQLKNYYSVLAQFYNEKGDQTKARQYVDSTEKVLARYDLAEDVFIQYRKGAIVRDEGNHQKAIRIFEKVVNDLEGKSPSVNGIVYHNLGQSYAMLNDHRTAIKYYKLSLAKIKKYKSHYDHLPRVNELLAESYHALGEYQKAYLFANRSSELKEQYGKPSSGMSRHLVDVKDDFKEYKIQQDMDSRKREVETLNQEKKVLNLQRALLAGLVFFLALISMLYLRNQQHKLKAEKYYNQSLSSRNEEINSLNKDLEKRNAEQVIFSNIMTHDLKAPLRTIHSFSSLIEKNLKMDEVKKEAVLEYNEHVLESSSLMIKLIEDLLVYFKVGVDEKEFNEIDLNALVSGTLKSFSFDLNSKNIDLSISNLPKIKGSEELLKTVFHNLISNAIKYQPDEQTGHIPQISITTKSEGQQHIIYIQDNGIGINKLFQNEMFNSFSRDHSSAEYSGTGLGLFICREIMLKHKGEITLESSQPTETIFKLVFPTVSAWGEA